MTKKAEIATCSSNMCVMQMCSPEKKTFGSKTASKTETADGAECFPGEFASENISGLLEDSDRADPFPGTMDSSAMFVFLFLTRIRLALAAFFLNINIGFSNKRF